MQLQFSDGFDIQLGNGCVYVLPSYVTRLSKDDLKFAMSSEHKTSLIVAAGTDPKDQKVTLITADGKILVFDAPAFHIPPGPAVPTHGGMKIFLPNINDRWPTDTPGYFAESTWVIKRSNSALESATLETNYKGENNNKTSQADDQGRG